MMPGKAWAFIFKTRYFEALMTLFQKLAIYANGMGTSWFVG